jgi:hypothetical protein
LPNGDRIADFGSQSHYLPESEIGSPLPDSTGAVLIEVNPEGEVVRTYTFPYGWGIYRIVPIPLQTINDYDGATHTSDFNISLSTLNDIGGPTDIYYRINNGPTKTVGTDGQPLITTQGMNNTLEYWSVDGNGIAEFPHNVLTGIRLQKNLTVASTTVSTAPLAQVSSPLTILMVPAFVFVAAIVILLAWVMVRRHGGRSLM